MLLTPQIAPLAIEMRHGRLEYICQDGGNVRVATTGIGCGCGSGCGAGSADLARRWGRGDTAGVALARGALVEDAGELDLAEVVVLLGAGLGELEAEARGVAGGLVGDLRGEHVPLEAGEVGHGPDVVAPAGALLAADGLRVEGVRDGAGDVLVGELDPALGVVRLLGGGVRAAEVRALGVCGGVSWARVAGRAHLLAGGRRGRRGRARP